MLEVYLPQGNRIKCEMYMEWQLGLRFPEFPVGLFPGIWLISVKRNWVHLGAPILFRAFLAN